MKKGGVLSVFTMFFFLFSISAVFAQRGTARSDTIDIRFASPLPRSSEWGRSLDRLAAEWQRVTNNQVRVIMSHDGREGSEMRMLTSLSSDSIQVAVLTTAGIAEICPAVMNLSVPFLIKDEGEFDVVLENVLSSIESRVNQQFVIIAWSKGGWVYLYTKEQVLTPDDLRRQRIGTSPELRDMNTVFRTMGFNLVEADWTNLGPRLANNTVNTVYVIPSIIAPMQLHRSLNHMLDLPIAPVMGAIVMNRITWNKLSPAFQQEIVRSTQRMAAEFNASMARTEANAIAAMGRDGLSVNRPTQAQRDHWQTELQAVLPAIIGPIFDRELYTQINQILERYRSGR